MKKIIYFAVIAILMSFCLVNYCLAEAEITFSEDLKTVNYHGINYSRFDKTMISLPSSSNEFPDLTEEQAETIREITVRVYNGNAIIGVSIYYIDGSFFSSYFLNDAYADEHLRLINGQEQYCFINLEWPIENIVEAEKSALMGKKDIIDINSIDVDNYFDVTVRSNDGNLEVYTGVVMQYKDSWIYADLNENAFKDTSDIRYEDLYDVTVYTIEDNELILQLDNAMEAYYKEDMGFLFDDEFTSGVSKFFLIVVFAVFPAIVFALFLILFLRSKTFYKKLFGIICALSAAELVMFTVMYIIAKT